MFSDDGTSVSGRRTSKTRRASQVSLQHSGDIPVSARRTSRVRLLSSDGSMASGEPIELNMINHNFSQGIQRHDGRRESRLASTIIIDIFWSF